MKKLSQSLLADIVSTKRKSKNMTQQDFIPSILQLENLAEVLDFEPSDLFINSEIKKGSLAFKHNL